MIRKPIIKLTILFTLACFFEMQGQVIPYNGNPDTSFETARKLAFNQQRKQAQDTLTNILTKYPDYHDIRSFLAATYSWDGDYKKARTYLVNDSTNNQIIDIYEKDYNNSLPPEDKKAYKTASIRFLKETHEVNDSTTIVHYSNSYKNRPDSLKIVKLNGQWFIDLNFTFQSQDSIPQ